MKIKELKLKMKEIEVMGRITSKRIQHTDFPKLAKATLEDETGLITLNLWRNQVDQVKVGDFVSMHALK